MPLTASTITKMTPVAPALGHSLPTTELRAGSSTLIAGDVVIYSGSGEVIVSGDAPLGATVVGVALEASVADEPLNVCLALPGVLFEANYVDNAGAGTDVSSITETIFGVNKPLALRALSSVNYWMIEDTAASSTADCTTPIYFGRQLNGSGTRIAVAATVLNPRVVFLFNQSKFNPTV